MTPLIRPFFTNGQINLRVQSTMKNEGCSNDDQDIRRLPARAAAARA